MMAMFSEAGHEVRISRLTFVEVQSVFALKVRSGAISRHDAGLQRSRLLIDIAAGEMKVWDVIASHFAAAEKLIGRHSFAQRLRTLDALQLGVTMELAQIGLADYFVVADCALGEVAAA